MHKALQNVTDANSTSFNAEKFALHYALWTSAHQGIWAHSLGTIIHFFSKILKCKSQNVILKGNVKCNIGFVTDANSTALQRIVDIRPPGLLGTLLGYS